MTAILKKLFRRIELPEEEQTNRWSNDDIRPVPLERQTWGSLQYFELWFLVNMNLSKYQTGSALIATGMTYWQAIIVIITGNCLAACFAVLNSVSGAQSHIGFPVVSRSVWGMWGSFFPILNRTLLSIVWFGVQAVIGGRMIYVCLRSIWIDLDKRIPNTLPASTGITTGEFMGYILFNLACCIFMWFRPHQLRPYFHGASTVVCITLFILLGWAVGTSDGWGAIGREQVTTSSSTLGWNMCAGIMSVIGSIAAGILNQNDFTRFAKRPSQVTWSQGISFVLAGNIAAIVGVLVTSATQDRYGKGTALWDPSKLFRAIQDEHGSGGRAAAFFLAIVMIISQLSINVVGNVLAGGLDVAAMFPKHVNLRRGAYIIAALSVLPNPWQQLVNGSTFLAVLSAYAVFLGPMIGLFCVHFYIIQKRQFHIPDLYEGSRASLYWYWYGINWRTVVAWALAVIPSMPGFVHRANANLSVPTGATRVYSLSFVLGFFIAAILAYILHLVFPVHMPDVSPLEEANALEGIDISVQGPKSTMSERKKATTDSIHTDSV